LEQRVDELGLRVKEGRTRDPEFVVAQLQREAVFKGR